MTEEIMELVRTMGQGDWDEGVLETVCETVEAQLESRLRPGVTPKDCGGAFPIAAAWLALELLEGGGGQGDVESFSAGDLTVHTGGAARQETLRRQALRLMAPYCIEEGFAFQGVPG
jgi:hypothetical protein